MAEMVLDVKRTARETPELFAAVVQVEADHGPANVIPAVTRFTVDLRSPDVPARADVMHWLQTELHAIAARRGIGISLRTDYGAPALTCAMPLLGALERSVDRLGVRPLRLASGAGHDGLAAQVVLDLLRRLDPLRFVVW